MSVVELLRFWHTPKLKKKKYENQGDEDNNNKPVKTRLSYFKIYPQYEKYGNGPMVSTQPPLIFSENQFGKLSSAKLLQIVSRSLQ